MKAGLCAAVGAAVLLLRWAQDPEALLPASSGLRQALSSVGETLDGQLRVFRESGDLALEGEIRTRLGLEALEAVVNARGDRLTLTADARGSEFGRVQANASVRALISPNGCWGNTPGLPVR